MRNNLKDYTELWQLQDSITTAVNACGYGIWDLCPSNGGFRLELSTHIEEEDISNLCCQLPLMTDYEGEGRNGSMFSLQLSSPQLLSLVANHKYYPANG